MAKQRQNIVTQFERSKQSERAIAGVMRVLPWFFRGFPKLKQPIIFSEKQDTCAHNKGCLECLKNINN